MEETSTTNRKILKSSQGKKQQQPAGRGRYNRISKVQIANTKKDGYAWNNTGSKKLAHAKFRKYYYRCAHKDKGCGARRHVQKLEDGSEMFRITYIGSHTCQNMNKNTHMSEIPSERSRFGSGTEEESVSEGGKRQQPGLSSKRRKLVKAGSNVVMNISSESHDSLEIDRDAVQSSRDAAPCTGNVVLEKGHARRREKKIVFSESDESSDHDTGRRTGKVGLEKGLATRRERKIVFSESDESSDHDTAPRPGNVVLEKGHATRRERKIVFSESDESSDHVTGRRTDNVGLEKGHATRRERKIVFSESDASSDHDTGRRTDNVGLEKGHATRRERKVVFSESGESSDHDTGPHSGNIVLEAPVSARNRRRAKQISFPESDESDRHVLDRVRCLPELVTGLYERKAKREARLRDQIARFRLRMTRQAAKNVKLANMVKNLKKMRTLEKGQEEIRMPAKNANEHAKVVEALQKELENARVQTQSVEHAYEKLKQEHELEKDGRRQERVSLEKSLEQVSSERQWLIQEGFEYVVNRLHRSQEYLGLLGAVQSNLWDSGVHFGLVQCYESCKDGVALEDVFLYNPGAHEKFLKAVHELEHTRFPYIVALSQCADRSLDDLRALEPIGLEKRWR